MHPLLIYTFSNTTSLAPRWWGLSKVQLLPKILGILSTQIHLLKSITPIFFYFKKKSTDYT